jgi:AcrR family transcriptional regulator
MENTVHRSVQQNQEMRAATQAAVLESTLALFARHGYAHTSTRRIAQEAGISTGLMYHYFASKESLLHAVFAQSMLTLSTLIKETLTASPPQTRLADLLRAMFALLAEDRAYWELFYMLRTQPAIMRELGDGFRTWTGQLRGIFAAELRQRGRREPELDAFLLYSLVEGTIQQFLLDPEHYPLDAVVTRIIDEYCPE